MKKIVAINASPRKTWNTATLVKEAAKGAEASGAEIKYFDLYDLEKFTGCIACFGCKLPGHLGACACKDGLAEVLEEIRGADGIIIGTPNYLGDVSSAFRALYERLVFQYISYKKDPANYNERSIPVLLIMTSNCAEAQYPQRGYDRVLDTYKKMLSDIVGPTEVLICGETLQVDDYSIYNWTKYDPEVKKARHEEVFPGKMKDAYELVSALLK